VGNRVLQGGTMKKKGILEHSEGNKRGGTSLRGACRGKDSGPNGSPNLSSPSFSTDVYIEKCHGVQSEMFTPTSRRIILSALKVRELGCGTSRHSYVKTTYPAGDGDTRCVGGLTAVGKNRDYSNSVSWYNQNRIKNVFSRSRRKLLEY